MDLEVTDELLVIAKAAIRVTWSHQDELIKQMTRSGMADLQRIVGPLSFDGKTAVSINAIDILRQRVRYDWNGVLSEFKKDYGADMRTLQINNALERRRKK